MNNNGAIDTDAGVQDQSQGTSEFNGQDTQFSAPPTDSATPSTQGTAQPQLGPPQDSGTFQSGATQGASGVTDTPVDRPAHQAGEPPQQQ
jgi:hypothetical protein